VNPVEALELPEAIGMERGTADCEDQQPWRVVFRQSGLIKLWARGSSRANFLQLSTSATII
jgi:hypothetical protein